MPSRCRGDDGDPQPIRQGDRLGLIQDDRLARLDRQDAAPRLADRLDGRRPDGWHVEAHILLRFGDLDDDEASLATKLTGAEDRAVGPLDRLDGEDRLVLDGDALADVEPAHLLRELPAEA